MDSYVVSKPMNRIGVSLNCFRLGDFESARMAFEICKQAGYHYAEAFATFQSIPISEICSLGRSVEIPVRSYHFQLDQLRHQHQRNQILESLKSFEVQTVICSGVFEDNSETCKLLNALSLDCRRHELKCDYHLFDFAYTPLDTENSLLDDIVRQTPDTVGFVIDTYWAAVANHNSIAVAKRLQDRCSYIHLKDGIVTPAHKQESFSEEQFTQLGDGHAQISDFLKWAAGQSLQYDLVVELDELTEQISPHITLRNAISYVNETLTSH